MRSKWMIKAGSVILITMLLLSGLLPFSGTVAYAQGPEEKAEQPEIAAAPAPIYIPGYYQTSEFMIGRVAVGVILPESVGINEPSTENWSPDRQAKVLSEISAALKWWTARSNGQVQFILDVHNSVPTGYEPINHPQAEESLWISQTMRALGHPGTSHTEMVYSFNNALRKKLNADWAFTIFVVDSLNDPDGFFADNAYYSYTYIGGPFMVMTFDNGTYSIENMDALASHEIGHIFYALDQYEGAQIPYTTTSGYLDAQNGNTMFGPALSNEESIMRGQTAPYLHSALDYYASGQVGFWDRDNDTIPDVIDTTPAISINSTTNPTFTGSTYDIPFNSPSHADVTINTIAQVEFRVDGGAWQPASASDGAFDSATEYFSFTPTLTVGSHIIEVRAINSAGNASYVKQGLTIEASSTSPDSGGSGSADSSADSEKDSGTGKCKNGKSAKKNPNCG
ncbi:MAG: hypothetical protein ACE5NP_00260 [Anaerolineae bacterium]